MEGQVLKLVDRIGSRYGDFTANEKRIFDLMNRDLKSFSLRSIGDVAGELNLSKTTLMRFAKSCGFNGYAEFKRMLQQEVLLDVSPVRKMEQVINNDYSLNGRELCARELENIQSTFESLDEAKLDTLVEMISSAAELYTLSWGVSSHLADIFGLRMKMMGIRCTTISRKHGTLTEETSLLKEGDLLLVFEVPPYNQEMIETVSKLAERKVHIILVSDSARCPLTSFAKLSFFCPTDAMFFGNSLIGPLFWVNLVSSMVIYRRKDEVMDLLEEQQKIFNDNRYYRQ